MHRVRRVAEPARLNDNFLNLDKASTASRADLLERISEISTHFEIRFYSPLVAAALPLVRCMLVIRLPV